jgi:hypothetical protein
VLMRVINAIRFCMKPEHEFSKYVAATKACEKSTNGWHLFHPMEHYDDFGKSQCRHCGALKERAYE